METTAIDGLTEGVREGWTRFIDAVEPFRPDLFAYGRRLTGNAFDATHVVGHSLGGLVALRMFAMGYCDAPGRIVCLGSPLCGSRAANVLHTKDWGEHLLGHSLPEGTVHSTANEWAQGVARTREIGIVAGTVPVGIGRIAGEFGEPNDGSVTVAETRLDGAKDHICLEVSHKTMLVSPDVVDQAAAFLKRGEFLRDL